MLDLVSPFPLSYVFTILFTWKSRPRTFDDTASPSTLRPLSCPWLQHSFMNLNIPLRRRRVGLSLAKTFLYHFPLFFPFSVYYCS
jgi:hypothetical protein